MGGGIQPTKFCTGMLRLEVQTITLLYTTFDQKGAPVSFFYPYTCCSEKGRTKETLAAKPFQTPYDNIPYHFYTSIREIRTLLYTCSVKKLPFRPEHARTIIERPSGFSTALHRTLKPEWPGHYSNYNTVCFL